ncbi:MAG: family cryptochrome, partial [Mucilaginibacter sp.]|nr:family cryptochrome [Mucilaginibacter sp.]
QQLQQYIENRDQTIVPKGVKHGAGADHSSKLSAWISMGCLSQRWVYREVTKYGNGGHASNSPLILALLWRDYFRFMFKKHGKQFFNHEGSTEEAPGLAPGQDELFEKWKTGHTGVPFVDASMHELNATGYINNYNRQIVAGFLVDQLKVDWTKGAAYFEEKLIDYSPASNFGNWSFVTGISNDPRDNRYFTGAKQAVQLDTKSDFITTWLPDVYDANNSLAHAVTL